MAETDDGFGSRDPRRSGPVSGPGRVGRADVGRTLAGPPAALCILIDDWGIEQLRWWVERGLSPYLPGARPTDLALTPNLDRFFGESVVFPRCFASSVCSPTRAQILTGRYPLQTGIGAIVTEDGSNGPFDCPADQGTVYTHAAALGVASAHFGKLHLVRNRALTEARFPGLPESEYPPPEETFAKDVLGVGRYRGIPRNVNNPPIPLGGPSDGRGSYFDWFEISPAGLREARTEWVTERQFTTLSDWVTRRSDPFLAHLWLTACHGPFAAENFPPASLRPTGRTPSEKDVWNNAKGMVEAVDVLFGRLRSALEASGWWDRTAIFFLADNGTDARVVTAQQAAGQLDGLEPARFKGEPYVHGTNVPLAVKPPASYRREAGVRDDLVDVVDLRPTMVDVLRDDGAATLEGVSRSFVGALRSPNATRIRRYSYASRFTPNGSIEQAVSSQEAIAFAPSQAPSRTARVIFRTTRGAELEPEPLWLEKGREVPAPEPGLVAEAQAIRAELRAARIP